MTLSEFQQKTLRIFVIVLSDRAAKGEYIDESGEIIKNQASNFLQEKNFNFEITKFLIPDEKESLISLLNEAKKNCDIVFTSGGTGISQRDITVDVVKPLLTKELSGIMEWIRIRCAETNPNALLSRAVAGIIENFLIFTLPGSPRATREYLKEIFLTLEHALLMFHNVKTH